MSHNSNKPKTAVNSTVKVNKNKFFLRLLSVVLVLAICVTVIIVISQPDTKSEEQTVSQVQKPQENVPKKNENEFSYDDRTIKFTNQIDSEYGILVELGENRIVAEKECEKIVYPASLTKILSLLVAVENLNSLDDTFQMTAEIIDPVYLEGTSMAGFLAGEVVTAKDLLYGMILPSGADAAQGIAYLVGGTEEHFVEMMNQKVKDLGITTAHFCNASGIHNKDHYCTVKDIAIIFNAALKNSTCKEILSTFQYTTQPTNKHPEGILLTNTMFSRMTGEEPGTAKILAGKTGFVNESGNCLASYGVSETGKEYIFVTAMAHGIWKSVWDHINTYRDFTEKLPSNNSENSQ